MPPLLHGRILLESEGAVRAELRHGVWHVRIKWRGLPDEDATWEQLEVGVGTKPVTRNPNPKNPNPNPKNPKLDNPNTLSGCVAGNPKLLRVCRV
jgi:hypothetical protein